MQNEIIEVEAQDLVSALTGHRKTVQQFQTTVTTLDSSIAALMVFLDSWMARLEKLKERTTL